MNWSWKIARLVVDSVKLILIFAVCITVAVVGSYLMAIPVGLIPKDSEYYRPLSVNTVLNDIPFIGTNMIYIIGFLLLLTVVYVSFWWYERYTRGKDGKAEKQAEAPLQPTEAKQ